VAAAPEGATPTGEAAEPGRAYGARFPRARRITRSREIRGLFTRGKRSRTAHLDVFDSTSPVAYVRIGLVVPKHRHTVVERNRLKRRLREIVRTVVLPGLAEAGVAAGVLLRARREAYGASFDELLQELTLWVNQRCSRGR
jgi:ribonuclease P protein component